MRTRLPTVVVSIGYVTACVSTLTFAADLAPGVHAEPSHVGLYGHAMNSCWAVAFSGPDKRAAIIRAAAEARFEKPSPIAIAAAVRKVVDVYVWPESKMDCGDELPEALVVRDREDATTIRRIPLAVEASNRSNAFGASKVFGEGKASLTFASCRELFDAERVVYLITSGGRRGGWRVGEEMRAVDDAAAYEASLRQARRQTFIDRFEDACGEGEPKKAARWMHLDIIKGAIVPPTDGVAKDVAKGYLPCIERLAESGSSIDKESAIKLLTLVR